MFYLQILSAVAMLSFFAAPFLAQTPRAAAAADSEKSKTKQDLIEARRLMIEEMIEAGRGFRLPENKAYVLFNAATLLWKTDEKRAQELYREAMALFLELQRLPEDGPDAVPDQVRWQLANLRQQLMQSLSQHNPALALEFLEATRVPADQQNPGASQQEAYIEASLLQQIAAKDPKRAYERGQKLIAEDAPLSSLWPLITSLWDQDFEAAKNLSASILTKVQSESPLSAESTMFLMQLISTGHPVNQGETTDVPSRKSLISAAEARPLIDKVVLNIQKEITAARQQNDQERLQKALGQLSMLNAQAETLEKFAPASAASVKRNWTQAEQLMGPQQRGWEALNRLAEKGSVEAIVEAAAKAPQELRQSYYQRASQLAMEKGDLDAAKSIIKDHTADKTQLRYMLEELDRQVVWRKIGENKFDEARKLAPKFRNVLEQVNFLVSMAQNAQNQGKKEIAVELLEEAWALVDGPAESNLQLSAQLQLAGVYVTINPTRSFEILESSIEQINELSAAAAVIESFQEQGAFRKKELLLISGGGMSGQYVHPYTQALATLMPSDPEHVQTIIGRFSRPEIRVLLQSLILQQSQGALQAGGIGFGGGGMSLGPRTSVNSRLSGFHPIRGVDR
jgi:hypothetical protein